MSKREPRRFLTSYERSIVFELGRDGKFVVKSGGWDLFEVGFARNDLSGKIARPAGPEAESKPGAAMQEIADNERDPAHGLDPTDKFIGRCYLLPLCTDNTYGGRTHRLLYGRAVCEPTAKTQQDKNRGNMENE